MNTGRSGVLIEMTVTDATHFNRASCSARETAWWGFATTDHLRCSLLLLWLSPSCARLRLRLHGVNNNKPSPTAVGETGETLETPGTLKECCDCYYFKELDHKDKVGGGVRSSPIRQDGVSGRDFGLSRIYAFPPLFFY